MGIFRVLRGGSCLLNYPCCRYMRRNDVTDLAFTPTLAAISLWVSGFEL